jgi:hypothetical protein
VVPEESLKVEGSTSSYSLRISEFLANKFTEHEYLYVDKEQSDAFTKEYTKVPQDKRAEFLADRRLQVSAIYKVRCGDIPFSFL